MDTPLTYTRAGDSWLFSDGTTLPVIAGGDGTEGGDAPVDAPADPTPAPDATSGIPDTDPSADAGDTSVVDEPDASTEDEADPFDDPAADTFERAYVERLRNEAAAKRVELKAFNEAFDGYDEADRGVLLDLARTLREDPSAAAEWMRAQAEAILGAGEQPGDEGPDAGDVDDIADDAPLTKADLDRIFAEREQASEAAAQAAEAKAAEEAAVTALTEEAKGLGYDPEGEDSDQYVALLHLANTKTEGDLSKAHEILAARKQKTIDAYLAAKAEEAKDSATTPAQTGAGREADSIPEGWGSDFRAHVRSRLPA